jgi:hypothetical protein
MSKNMATPLTTIFDQLTGEEVTREMTATELAQWKSDQQAIIDSKAAQDLKATAKDALLERLGITEDEAKLLFA